MDEKWIKTVPLVFHPNVSRGLFPIVTEVYRWFNDEIGMRIREATWDWTLGIRRVAVYWMGEQEAIELELTPTGAYRQPLEERTPGQPYRWYLKRCFGDYAWMKGAPDDRRVLELDKHELVIEDIASGIIAQMQQVIADFEAMKKAALVTQAD